MSYSFKIPRARVHLLEEKLMGGDLVVEKQPMTALVGGAQRATLGGGNDKIFMIVNIGGDPALTRAHKQKTFHAASPGYAAKKAFYSWWRSMRKTDEAMKICIDQDRGLALAPTYSAEQYSKLCSHLNAMESKAEDKELFGQRRSEYEHAWKSINQAALDEALLVRLAILGSKSNYAPRNYIVQYVPNTNPNWMEFWGPNKGIIKTYNPIVVNAEARLAKPTDPLPPKVHYLEHDLQLMS